MPIKTKSEGLLKNRPEKDQHPVSTTERVSRGPKPGLTTEQIARAAISVADAEGLSAISMQRIAGEVHVTTMALYRYFSSKQELIALMVDNVAEGPPNLDFVSGGWQTALAQWTRLCAAIYRKHPWFLEVTSSPNRMMGPNELEWLDSALAVLSRTGLDPHEQHQAFLLLIGHIRSQARYAAQMSTSHSAVQSSVAAGWLNGGDKHPYPALFAALEAGAFRQPLEAGLEFGIECILRGIESLVRKRKRAR